MQKITLNGLWKLNSSEAATVMPSGVWMDAAVPGNVQASLSENGVLPKDLFFGKNLLKAKPTENKCWWYKREFTFAGQPKDNLKLVFEGLDLFASVYLNGEKLGDTENMFLRYDFDVKNKIKQGKNEITVVFLSTKKEVAKRVKKYPDYWTIFYPGSTLVRKAQCHFGWDWAPEMITVGIWGDVYLENYDNDTIQDVYVETQLDGELCFRVKLYSELSGKTMKVSPREGSQEHSAEAQSLRLRAALADKTLRVTVKDGGKKVVAEGVTTGIHNFVNLKLKNPQYWWPRGMGEPRMYDYCVELIDGKKVRDAYHGSFGIRKVEFVEKILSNKRMGFNLKINDVPVFCKGANWVPADCFPGTVKDSDYERLVAAAAEANFNIIRIWGGGVYEKNSFYQACDKQGIMVWQDFMNSCGHPPDDKMWFLDNVLKEAEYQVARLRRHPSVVVWCGGNESSNPWFYCANPPGRKLLHYYLRGIIGDHVVNTPYISSSPHSKSDMGGEETSGETHGSSWPRKKWIMYTDFRDRIARSEVGFNSEVALFGPSPLESLKKFVPENELWPATDTVLYHWQKHPDPEMPENFFVDQVRMAEQLVGPCKDAREFVNNAMMASGEMVFEELTAHRSKQYANGGAMLWMYNECWPNSNWAMVDYFGAKKASFYAAKRAFAPMTPAIRYDGHRLAVCIINGTLKDTKSQAVVSYRDIVGRVFWTKKFDVRCPQNTSTQFSSVALKQLSKPNSFLRVECTLDKQMVSVNYFPTLWKDVAFEPAVMTYELLKQNVKSGSAYRSVVKITAKNYCRFVSIDVPDMNPREVVLQDNYFDLIPGESRTITVCTMSKMKGVRVGSLFA